MSWIGAHPFLTVAVAIYVLVALGCLFASLAEMAGRSRLRTIPVLMGGAAAMFWPVTLLVLSAWTGSAANRRKPGSRSGPTGGRVAPGRLRPSA